MSRQTHSAAVQVASGNLASGEQEKVMKKVFAALALISTAFAASTQAADVGLAITVGQPGFYGQLDMGRVGPPQVVYRQPVVVERRFWNPAPMYVRVPQYQYGNWRSYCGRYNACGRPVYFVRDDWYRNVYSPRYHRVHGNGYAYGHAQPYAYQRYGDDHRYDRNYDRRDYDRDHRNDGGNNDRHDDRGRPHN
jgi:hypothetical protein